MTNVPAAAFIAGAAVQQAHRASDLAAQAANHALHQQQAADQARQEAGRIRERAVREVSDVRVQAAQLASQAQQAVQTAQHSEAQARQLIEQTRQEALGHVENARQVVNATQQDAQQEVQRIVQEAQQAILQREQTIASQEHTIRGLSQENSVMHQRLGDLERVVAQLTQQARATPVPMQESPPKAASIAETATETSAAKASSQGTVPPGTHQPVGAPQVSSSQDASGVAASSQGNAFTSTIPDPPCGSVQSSGLGHDAPADSRDPGGGATSQHLVGHSAVLGATSPVGDAAPGTSRTIGLGRDGSRDQADVRVQVTALAEMVQQLSQLVANQVAPPPPPPAAPPPVPPIPLSGAPPPPKAGSGTHVPPVPITMLGGLYSSSPQAPSAASSDTSSHSNGDDDTPQCRVCGGSHEDTDCPYLTMNGGGGGGGGPGQFPNADPSQAADPSVGMTANDHATHEESVVRVKDLKDLVLPSPPENAGQARGFVNQVLMAIGRLQKTPGDEVYQWAQACMSSTEQELIADKRFPRLDREIAAKLLKTCRKGKFGLLFQNMVEQERISSGGMPVGRIMLRAIFKHFQLERGRLGSLGGRNLLKLSLAGPSLADLDAFREKYVYVLTAIPVAEQPRETTLFDHLLDELEKCTALKPKVEKAREAPFGSHRRKPEWLWSKVDLALELHQDKRNRDEFDKSLQIKPAVMSQGNNYNAMPAASSEDKPKKSKKSKKDKSADQQTPAAPAPKVKAPKPPPPKANAAPAPKGKGKGGSNDNLTPRSKAISKTATMTAAEKAKMPCMFYAYNSCKAKQCAFLHSDTNKYTGPKPKSLLSPPPPKASAAVAQLIPAMASVASDDNRISWLWDTAAGRHLIGRQALNSNMIKCVRESSTPVGYATGGGAQQGTTSLGFEDSRVIPAEEQVYVLRDCPPAQSIGKNVMDQGHLFIWDPRENVPYLVPPKDISRCKINVPRNARITASRVVEYAPQYDEVVKPKLAESSTHLWPIEAAAMSAAEDDVVSLCDDSCQASDEGEIDQVPVNMLAAEEAPPPEDELPLIAFGDGDPTHDNALKEQAKSPEHLRSHFPKNPFCKVCSISKTTSARVAHKKDARSDDKVDVPTAPFQQLATDSVILAMGDEHLGVGFGGIKSHHVVRDVFSGVRLAYPVSRRDTQAHVKNFRQFMGLRATDSPPTCLVKMDAAGELEGAAHEVGLVPETSLPNRWPHNTVLERDIREEKECCRSIHMQSGLPYSLHTFSYPFACLSMSFDRPAPFSPGKTQCEALTKEKFQGKRCCFGQLVWYRTKTPGKRTLDPNMAPALFLGWRVDPGLRYRNVVKVMDYEAFRKDGSISVHDVPEPELFVEDGPPSFPIAAAADRALHGGKTEGSDPPPLPLREAPFGAPPTPSAVKSKSVYITVERIIKFKETPGCRACTGHSKIHSAECKKRFSELVSADRAEAAAKSAAKTESKEPIPIVHTEGDEELARAIHASEHGEDPEPAVSAEDVAHEFDAAEAGEPAPSRPGGSFFDTAPATAATSHGEDFWVFKENANCLVRYHIMPRQKLFTPKEVEGCPVSPERFTAARTTRAVFQGGKADNIHDGWFGSRPNRSLGDAWTGFTVFKLKPIQSDCVITTGAAVMLDSVPPTPLTEASKNGRPNTLPVFGMPCSAEVEAPQRKQFEVGNHRARKKQARIDKLPVMFEYACSPESNMGRVFEGLGIPHVRLAKEFIDLSTDEGEIQLQSQIEGCDKPNLWAAIPCTSGSAWQRLNKAKLGSQFKKKLKQKVKESRELFSRFRRHAETVLHQGSSVSFEWPRDCDSWARDDVSAFFREYAHVFTPATFHGCALGLKDSNGYPIKKPWKVMTSNSTLASALGAFKCPHEKGYKHSLAAGNKTAKTAFYPEGMCLTVARALYPTVQPAVPAMPVQVPLPLDHREREQQLKHISPLSGLEDIGVAVESDERCHNILEQVLDVENLIAHSLGQVKEKKKDPEITAMVTRLLSRAEMLASPEALEAVRLEATGLEKAGAWDLNSVREYDQVAAEARRSSIKVHFGQLMSLASVKFAELAKHLQKMKGRIVYRGDCAKDEHGAAAVYQELGANPTSVQGLNNCLAYGSLPGNSTTTADAIKAYVQALLKSKYQTWITLPPELRPRWWRERFVKPVVLLVKALYGHPDAGGLWEAHLKGFISELGGREVAEFPGNFWFKESGLLLSTYVDDLTLAGPSHLHKDFWEKLTRLVDIEPPEDIYRVLGRNHLLIDAPKDPTEPDLNAAMGRLKGGMAFDMRDYARQTVALYLEVAQLKSEKLRDATTPFCPAGSLDPADDALEGELGFAACRVLMKALWLGRLARPDLVKPIGDLASFVQKWSRNCDKQLHRLVCYINSTVNSTLVGTVQDSTEDLHLSLYVDADFAGERDAKSTSGGFLILSGPHTHFPLAWVSKRQTSVSRSTTEAEIVSLAYSLYQEALPALSLWELILDRPFHLKIHEDNQATILVARKGFSSKLRCVQRTHKVNLACIAEQLESEHISIEYVQTDMQSADIFTKALPPNKWDHAIRLLGIRVDLPEKLQDVRESRAAKAAA